jgi:OmpA-OmpF porin, OOP family
MKLSAVFLFSLMLLSWIASSQKAGRNVYRHPSVLEAHFSISDFNEVIGTSRKIDPGIGIGYIGPLNHFLDWSVEVNGSYTGRIIRHSSLPVSDKKLLLETAGLLRGRLFSKESWVQPYITAGIGALNYKSRFTGFIPAGIGLQFSYHNIFLLLNAQYRWSFARTLNAHNYYGIGIGGLIGKKRVRKRPVASPLPVTIIQAADTDGDGIKDPEDACPDRPGMLKYNGCPDTDGDGLEDREDNCPQVFGMSRLKGCPIPDTDKDGINDEEDSCITVIGIRENKGCPIVKKELTDAMKNAARNIFFPTNKYTILPVSFTALSTVISILQSDPALKLTIEGHTDNQGTPESNQVLSQNRANAVANYLIKEGIDAGRLKAAGFGQTQPVDDNGTPAGRANNRRVEMKLYF